MKKILLLLLIGLAGMTITASNYDVSRENLKKREGVVKQPMTVISVQDMYPLAPSFSYFENWVDWPLFVNPAWYDKELSSRKYQYIGTYEDRMQRQKNAELYGIDGFCFFPFSYQKGRVKTLAYMNRANRPGFYLYYVMGGPATFMTAFEQTMLGKKQEPYLKNMLESKFTGRLDGKIPLLNYRGGLNDNFLKNYDKSKYITFGNIDHTRYPSGFQRYIMRFAYANGELTKTMLDQFRDTIRQILRKYDGLSVRTADTIYLSKGRREINFKYLNEVFLPVISDVMAEKEFKNKYLSIAFWQGHQNQNHKGYYFASCGTRTLRNYFELALKFNADMMSGWEWDEQNENTSLRPTVYSSFAAMRIIRYYTSRMKNKALKALPRDDLSIPNLILSARKIVTLGERIEFELLNVPDSKKKTPYTVNLQIKSLDGKVLKEFSNLSFDSSKMHDHVISIASEDYADHVGIIPSLTINYKGKKQNYETGLHPVEIRPAVNSDYKWVSQPLRDISFNVSGKLLKEDSPEPDLNAFKVSVKSPKTLNNLQLISNGKVVYDHEKAPATLPRENDSQYVIRALVVGLKHGSLSGSSIRIVNGKMFSQIIAPQYNPRVASISKSNTLFLYGAYHFPVSQYMVIDRKESANASFDILLKYKKKEFYHKRISLKELLKNKITIIPCPGGITLALQRFLRQAQHAPHLNLKDCDFTVNTLPDSPYQLNLVQTIDSNHKIWRSKPVVTGTKLSGEKRTMKVYSETKERMVKVAVPCEYVPELRYKPDLAHDALIPVKNFFQLSGVGGGFAFEAQMKGKPSAALINYRWGNYKPEAAAPKLVKQTDGEYALAFNGKDSFMVVPQGVLPRRAGFELSFDLNPELTDGAIFSNSHMYVAGGFNCYLKDGVLQLSYTSEHSGTYAGRVSFYHDSKLQIPVNKWSKITITYDLETVQVEVNGVKSKASKCPGPAWNDTTTTFGAVRNKAFYKGMMRNIVIKHTF